MWSSLCPAYKTFNSRFLVLLILSLLPRYVFAENGHSGEFRGIGVKAKTGPSISGQTWTKEDYGILRSTIAKLYQDPAFARVLGVDTEDRSSALGELCTNFSELDSDSKIDVWSQFFLAMAMSESSLHKNATDEDDPHTPYGYWQISKDISKQYLLDTVKKGACNFKSGKEIKTDIPKNIECMLAMFELRHFRGSKVYGTAGSPFKIELKRTARNGVPYVYSPKGVTWLHWSVLRQGDKFEKKLAPAFSYLAPQCKMGNTLFNKVKKTTVACSQLLPLFNLDQYPATAIPINASSQGEAIANKCKGRRIRGGNQRDR